MLAFQLHSHRDRTSFPSQYQTEEPFWCISRYAKGDKNSKENTFGDTHQPGVAIASGHELSKNFGEGMQVLCI